MDEATAAWVRLEAARRDTSVSRLVGELLRERMVDEREYEDSMERYLSGRPRPMKGAGAYPSREEIHDRVDLR